MENETIKIWRRRRVRIKREYLALAQKIDDDASTFDGHDNIIEAVFKQYWITTMDNGFQGAVIIPEGDDIYSATFEVIGEFYGVDLYGVEKGTLLSELPQPSHHIVVKETAGWPYMWDSKYFEVVRKEYTWVADKDYE